MDIGDPVTINPYADKPMDTMVIDDNKMINMMARLSGVLPPLLRTMSPNDYSTCKYMLVGFFMPIQANG
jgi:hypothetical protein